jgi:predicted  nucleic acid-binding Zn-ribbon protein
MPHQCVHCGSVYPDGSRQLLEGCNCGSKFFYYIKQSKMDNVDREIQDTLFMLSNADKIQIEKDVREIIGLEEETDKPVILDLESVRIIQPGKFEIDIVNLFSKKRPLIYRLEEGKYIIDLAASMNVDKEELDKKIRDPDAEDEE